MELLAERLGSMLARQLELSAERQEVITFGAVALLQNGTTLLLLVLLALLLGILPESMVLLFAASVMRHAGGGIHLRTSLRCILVTTSLFLGAAYLATLTSQLLGGQPSWLWWMTILLCGAGGLVPVFLYAPVAAESRPLSPAHRSHLRRLSIRLSLVALLLFVSGGLFRTWWTIPAVAGTLFQGFTLTLSGRQIVYWLDQMLDRWGVT